MPKPDLFRENHMLEPEREQQHIGECDGCGAEIFLGDAYLRGPRGELMHDDNDCIRQSLINQGYDERSG